MHDDLEIEIEQLTLVAYHATYLDQLNKLVPFEPLWIQP